MDYKFLSKTSLNKFFEETDLTVGEILRSILQEKFSGIKVQNKNKLTEMTDQQWYEALDKAFEYNQD